MATNYPRKTALVFASGASAAPGGIAVYGSKTAGSPTYSTDLAVIQAGPGWLAGRSSALSGGLPCVEDDNGVDYTASSQIAYILQKGLPEWDLGTTYFKNNFCSYNGVIYQSVIDNNLNNIPSSSPSDWTVFMGISYENSDSSVTAANSGSVWTEMTGTNSVTLTPGTWEINSKIQIGDSLNDTLQMQAGYFAANGDNTGTIPALLSTISGLVVKSQSASIFLSSTFLVIGGGETDILMPKVVITLTTTSTIYLVPNISNAGTGANVTAETQISAMLISPATA